MLSGDRRFARPVALSEALVDASATDTLSSGTGFSPVRRLLDSRPSAVALTRPPIGRPRLIGADASPAGMAVHCLKAGWWEFDPTNDCLAGATQVAIVGGRDHGAVPPLMESCVEAASIDIRRRLR